VRTASSAVCPSRQRTGLVSKRKRFVNTDPGVSGIHPSGFVRTGIISQKVSPTYPRFTRGRLFVRTPVEHKLAAMQSGGSDLIGATQCDVPGLPATRRSLSGNTQKGGSGSAGAAHNEEFSCPKNWLFPRPPTNGGSRFWKKVS
jgi:hypothetical protein